MDWPCFETGCTLHEIIEGRMRGKPTTEEFKCYVIWQMVAIDCVALKWAAEDREGC